MPLTNGATHTYKAAPRKFGSIAPRCPTCDKSVYAAEQALGPGGKPYHTLCLKCGACSKILDSTTVTDHESQPFCNACYGRLFGPKGVGFGNALVGEYQVKSSPGSPQSPQNKSPGRPWSSRTVKGSSGTSFGNPSPERSIDWSNAGTLDRSTSIDARDVEERLKGLNVEDVVELVKLNPDKRLSDAVPDWDDEVSPKLGSSHKQGEDALHTDQEPNFQEPVIPNPVFTITARLAVKNGEEVLLQSVTPEAVFETPEAVFEEPVLPNPVFTITARSAAAKKPVDAPSNPSTSTSSSNSPSLPPRPLPTTPVDPTLSPPFVADATSTSSSAFPPPTKRDVFPPPPLQLKHSSMSPTRSAFSSNVSSAASTVSRTTGGSLSPRTLTRFNPVARSNGLGGGVPRCPRCLESVYHAEQVLAAERCLRCSSCGKNLDASLNERDGTPYCKKCYGDSFGTESSGFVLRPGFVSR